jgi:hypothetical protein
MFKNFKNVVLKTAALASLVLALNANAAPIKTDIIFIVDESGSMGAVQANLTNNIGLFASILSGGGVDANYGLVGYGASSADNIRTLTDLVDASSFATAAGNLIANGFSEPAFDAVAYALNSLSAQASSFSYRSDAITNIIVLTDEPSNGDAEFSFASTDALLSANNALFNAVLGQFALGDLSTLATNNGGNVFDLSLFASNDAQVVEDFVTDFANVKLQETLTFCELNPNDPACTNVEVPVPPLAALFGLAMAGVFLRRKA